MYHIDAIDVDIEHLQPNPLTMDEVRGDQWGCVVLCCIDLSLLDSTVAP